MKMAKGGRREEHPPSNWDRTGGGSSMVGKHTGSQGGREETAHEDIVERETY